MVDVNWSRVEIARERRQLTNKALAGLLNVTPRTLENYSKAQEVPAEKLELMSSALGFPVRYFQKDDPPTVKDPSFRRGSKLSSLSKQSVLASASIALELDGWISARYELPALDVPDLRSETPQNAARILRAKWGLGEKSISNMVHLLESKGVRVYSLVHDCRQVDAFSVMRDGAAYVFLNLLKPLADGSDNDKSTERVRFDAAHELGHLVLHQSTMLAGKSPATRVSEQEADAFASAFLMPEAAVRSLAPVNPILKDAVTLKRNWGVSLGAMVRRLKDLNLISEWVYRDMCIRIQKLGYRTAEPNGMPPETSQVLKLVLSDLRDQGIGRHKLAADVALPADDIASLMFGLTVVELAGDAETSPSRSGHLRLVKW